MNIPAKITLALVAALLLGLPACEARSAGEELAPRLEALAAAGNAEAAYHLGMIHHLGLEGPADPRKALDLFRKAAEGGDPLGAYKLGCYYHGQGEGLVEDDPVLALRYKLRAAEAGYSLAQHDVAMILYERGEPAEALAWMHKAAAQGNRGSLMALASLYNVGKGIPRDRARTYAYFTLVGRASEEPPTERSRQWLQGLLAEMTPEEKRRGDEIVSSWRIAPTPLTMKALSGQDAAARLVGR